MLADILSSLYYEPKISFLASRHVHNFENAARNSSAHCAYYLSVQDIGKTSLVHTGLVLISNQVSLSNHRADRVWLPVGDAVSPLKADRGFFL